MAKKKSAKKATPMKKANKKATPKKSAKKGARKAAAPKKGAGKKAPAAKKAPAMKKAAPKKAAPKQAGPKKKAAKKKPAPTITGRIGEMLGTAGDGIASVARFVAPPAIRGGNGEPASASSSSLPAGTSGQDPSEPTKSP